MFFLFSLGVLAFALACGRKGTTTAPRANAAASALPVAIHSLPPLPARPLPPQWQRVRERVMRAAATTRELSWLSAPGMIELSGWEYGTRTKEMADALGGEELRPLSRLGVAGGMLPAGTDLAMLAASFAAASAGATYSPLDRQILLLADSHGPEAANDSLLAHEFVHALQDQHFDLLKLLLVRPYNFDREEAAFAVVEGDAMNVQRRLEAGDAWTRRSLDDVARAEDARFAGYRKEIGALFPPLLTETFIFRYRDGVRFVEAVRRKGGAAAVDELFRQPPASSEQVLHPEKYFAHEEPRAVTVDEQRFAAHGWHAVTATPLGEIGVRGLLLGALPAQAAARTAAGWGGDRAYLFDSADGATLFVWPTAWDKTEDAEEFFRGYNALCQRTGQLSASPDPKQMIWHEGDRVTLVRRDGDNVIIMRGTAADVQAAAPLAVAQKQS